MSPNQESKGGVIKKLGVFSLFLEGYKGRVEGRHRKLIGGFQEGFKRGSSLPAGRPKDEP